MRSLDVDDSADGELDRDDDDGAGVCSYSTAEGAVVAVVFAPVGADDGNADGTCVVDPTEGVLDGDRVGEDVVHSADGELDGNDDDDTDGVGVSGADSVKEGALLVVFAPMGTKDGEADGGCVVDPTTGALDGDCVGDDVVEGATEELREGESDGDAFVFRPHSRA